MNTSLPSPVAQPHGREDVQHLLGGYVSVAQMRTGNVLASSNLANAAFWVHQRQDLFVAIINSRAPKTCSAIETESHLYSGEEYAWTKRATTLHAEVVDFCFGPRSNSVEAFLSIANDLDEWDSCKPVTFTPVHFDEPDSSLESQGYRDLCFTLDCCGKQNKRVSDWRHEI